MDLRDRQTDKQTDRQTDRQTDNDRGLIMSCSSTSVILYSFLSAISPAPSVGAWSDVTQLDVPLVGVLVVLAQVGSWVPATRARLTPVDAIIAVTPSTPSVTSGLSTFMVELNRMSGAVARATRRSLVLVDEFGASTYENDGASLLTACLDHWGAMTRTRRRRRRRRSSRSSSGEEEEQDDSTRIIRHDDDSEMSFVEGSGGIRGEEERSEGSRSRGYEGRNSDDEEMVGGGRRGGGGRGGGGERGRGCPHVFVSTHLLRIYDHLERPETVRPLVSNNLFPPPPPPPPPPLSLPFFFLF
ncbi:MutS 5 [Portunus trituberculatus]|uniref:MutS 5 n=1 Tax=Portunus trituberculatus TaxID=210409 RepID=A0A5B7G0P5_PORTR|nr:MutS 5 [Portunus trituberculatus]